MDDIDLGDSNFDTYVKEHDSFSSFRNLKVFSSISGYNLSNISKNDPDDSDESNRSIMQPAVKFQSINQAVEQFMTLMPKTFVGIQAWVFTATRNAQIVQILWDI